MNGASLAGVIVSMLAVGLLVLGPIVFIYVLSGLKLIYQYERGVVFTLGKFRGVREPGLRFAGSDRQTPAPKQ